MKRTGMPPRAPHIVDVSRYHYREALITAHELSSNAVRVGFALSKWMNVKDCANAYPGVERLQAATGQSRSQVDRAIAELTLAGYVVLTRPARVNSHPATYKGVIPASRWDATWDNGTDSNGTPRTPGRVLDDVEVIATSLAEDRRAKRRKPEPASTMHVAGDAHPVEPDGVDPWVELDSMYVTGGNDVRHGRGQCASPVTHAPKAVPEADTYSDAYASASPSAPRAAKQIKREIAKTKICAEDWLDSGRDSLVRLIASKGFRPRDIDELAERFLEVAANEDNRTPDKWRSFFVALIDSINPHAVRPDADWAAPRLTIEDWARSHGTATLVAAGIDPSDAEDLLATFVHDYIGQDLTATKEGWTVELTAWAQTPAA